MGYGTSDWKKTRKKLEESRSGRKPILCKARVFHKKCHWCTVAERLKRSKDEAEAELGSSIQAKPKYYMTILDLNDKNKGRQLFASNVTIWRNLCDLGPDPDDVDDVGIDFTHIKRPHPVIITKSGSGRDSKYTVQISPKAVKFPPSLLKKKPIDLSPKNLVKLLDEGKLPEWSPQTGKNKILIFPQWSEDAEYFFSELHFHWGTYLVSESEDGDDDEGGAFDEDDEFGEDEDFDDDVFDEDEEDDDEEEDEEEDEEDEEEVDFDEMSPKELRAFSKKNGLKIKKNLKGKALRRAVAKQWRKISE